jgi:hypothetical protein
VTTDAIALPEERLLVLMSYARPDARELEDARALAAKVGSWDLVWELAEHNATAPLVHANLVAAGLFAALPAAARGRFEQASAKVRAQNEARLAVARELFARFDRRRIPVVILKGVLFAETVYGNPHYKKMNDVDVLVRKRDLDAIFAIYQELGFFSAGELIAGESRKQEKFSHHAPPYFSKDLRCMIGTHWGLITPLAPYTIDYDAIWSRVVDVPFYGSVAKAMAPEDNLHHLCIHLPYYKTGIRELADLYNLVRHTGPAFDWELFLREVRKAGSENLVYHALSLSNRLCPLAEVTEVLRHVEPSVSAYYRDDAERKTRRLGGLLRSRSVHMSVIEKAFTRMNATQDTREKWQAFFRMWGNFLGAPVPEVIKLNSLHRPGRLELLRARAYTPWRISKVFIRDLGPGVFLLIMGKSIHDVVRASLRSSLQGEQVQAQDLAALMRERGIDPAAVEQLLEHLE